jgi:hypothetical protein
MNLVAAMQNFSASNASSDIVSRVSNISVISSPNFTMPEMPVIFSAKMCGCIASNTTEAAIEISDACVHVVASPIEFIPVIAFFVVLMARSFGTTVVVVLSVVFAAAEVLAMRLNWAHLSTFQSAISTFFVTSTVTGLVAIWMITKARVELAEARAAILLPGGGAPPTTTAPQSRK